MAHFAPSLWVCRYHLGVYYELSQKKARQCISDFPLLPAIAITQRPPSAKHRRDLKLHASKMRLGGRGCSWIFFLFRLCSSLICLILHYLDPTGLRLKEPSSGTDGRSVEVCDNTKRRPTGGVLSSFSVTEKEYSRVLRLARNLPKHIAAGTSAILRSQSVASRFPLAISLVGAGNCGKQPYCADGCAGKTKQTEERDAP